MIPGNPAGLGRGARGDPADPRRTAAHWSDRSDCCACEQFFQRMHAPSMGNTLGTGCVLAASVLVSSALANRPIVHEILITVFIVITAPMTAILLMRAAVKRSGVRHE